VNRIEAGYNKLTKDLREELEKKYEALEEFNNYSDYWLCSNFLDNMVIQMTTNEFENWHYCMKKREDESNCNEANKEFATKLHMLQTWNQIYNTTWYKNKQPWKEIEEDKILNECVRGSMYWLPRSVKVLPMPRGKAESAYRCMRRMRLTKLPTILNWMEFAGKLLKTENEKDKRCNMLVEATGCPVKHLGIVRLTYMHPRTLEGYSLWWNEGSLQEIQCKNSRISKFGGQCEAA